MDDLTKLLDHKLKALNYRPPPFEATAPRPAQLLADHPMFAGVPDAEFHSHARTLFEVSAAPSGCISLHSRQETLADLPWSRACQMPNAISNGALMHECASYPAVLVISCIKLKSFCCMFAVCIHVPGHRHWLADPCVA